MNRNVATVFCLLVCWNIGIHGEEEGEGGKTKSLKESEELRCKDVNPDSAIMKREISVFTVKLNSTGDWLTTFQADRDLDDSTTAVNLKIRQDLVRCGEDKRMVLRITGVMRDIDGEQFALKKQNTSIPEIKEEKEEMIVNAGANKRDCGYILRFHSNIKGNNVMITDNGTTASRIELKYNIAGVITERPLIDDEIFSIRIDRSDESYWKRKSHSPAFGLILNPTQDIRSSEFVFSKQGTWSSIWSYYYINGMNGKPYSLNMADIPDGTVLGITRKSNGDVHFFKNGLEVGKAFERVPKGVYAYFDVITYVTGNGFFLRFHSSIKGNNVMITDNGITACRMELKSYTAGVITERPLIDDEIFSIRIDKSDESLYKRKSYSAAFGLISNPTQDIRSSSYVFHKQGTWSSFLNYIYINGISGKPYSFNIADIPDGTVLGITRKSNGDVHFFKNGLEMGKAFEGVPKGVYAYFDVITYVTQISVVNEKCFN